MSEACHLLLLSRALGLWGFRICGRVEVLVVFVWGWGGGGLECRIFDRFHYAPPTVPNRLAKTLF